MFLLLFMSNALAEAQKKEKWWEQRQQREDIYYPHDKHDQVMQDLGDSCLLCHSFAKTQLTDPKALKPLTLIANEPLAAICHECHKENIAAPWDCKTCHPDKTTIWPEDHNIDYVYNHAADARADESGCRECHIELSFCTDCHFKSSNLSHQIHPLGYLSWHGLDVRGSAFACGKCHSGSYCQRCHLGGGR
ncbi:hypothetical protein QUF61_02255 [Candidatus Venteria ishoeyi]|uniref:hypothetical protein n=1 Tax=Candidatus Venteria ishoeyi TaxID=1899563 RepID=UPI0025A55CEB|nr:hypothetical protein [Candidatus Venteria ishoeyi]MDM8545294.1 hypothetical protein [Candidatus Venteria ishoeyi]